MWQGTYVLSSTSCWKALQVYLLAAQWAACGQTVSPTDAARSGGNGKQG
jgi:hypothetical protein